MTAYGLPRRALIYALGATDARWPHNPLGIFCFCAATTHFGSASTHVYPDSRLLVRPCGGCPAGSPGQGTG